MRIRIFYDDIKYRLRNSRKTIKLIEKVIIGESKIPGDLRFIMTTDEKLLKINREFLKRNNYTDVIAFNYNEKKTINGEIYISIDTVRQNAHDYNVSLKEEVKRVMLHGILHLCGYNDKTDEEKKIMRIKEDQWINYGRVL